MGVAAAARRRLDTERVLERARLRPRRARARSSARSSAARENARGARETHLLGDVGVPQRHLARAAAAAHGGRAGTARTAVPGFVRERAAMVFGLADVDDEPRRRLAVPRPRPQPGAGRHDRAAALHPRAGRATTAPSWTTRAALLRRLRGVPAHLPRRGRRRAGRRVPAAGPAVPAVGVRRAACSRGGGLPRALDADDRSGRRGRRGAPDRRPARTRLEFADAGPARRSCRTQLERLQRGLASTAQRRGHGQRYFDQTQRRSTVGPRGGADQWRRLAAAHQSTVTGFTYAGPVRSSYNEARMTPLTFPGRRRWSAGSKCAPGATVVALLRLLGHPGHRVRPARPARGARGHRHRAWSRRRRRAAPTTRSAGTTLADADVGRSTSRSWPPTPLTAVDVELAETRADAGATG